MAIILSNVKVFPSQSSSSISKESLELFEGIYQSGRFTVDAALKAFSAEHKHHEVKYDTINFDIIATVDTVDEKFDGRDKRTV